MLSWNQPEPGGEVAPSRERFRWSGRSHELIAFEEGGLVRSLDSFQSGQVEDLVTEFGLNPAEVTEVRGDSDDQALWIRYLK